MGILDDAIREHLDLKRRRGAEEGELAKLEDEAFGPPSRPGDPDFPEDEQATAQATAEPATREEAAATAVEPQPTPEPQPAAPEPEAVEPEPQPTPEPEAAEPQPTPVPESSAEPVPEPATPEPEAATPEPEQPAEPPIESLDTVEHPFEGAITETGEAEAVEGELVDDDEHPEGEADAEDEEDVLEETPEFLRDQPEDDELWFEQGEPKDFDF